MHMCLPIFCTQSLFDHIPVGVGSKGIIPMAARDLEEALEMGMDWSLREGYAWAEDKVPWQLQTVEYFFFSSFASLMYMYIQSSP